MARLLLLAALLCAETACAPASAPPGPADRIESWKPGSRAGATETKPWGPVIFLKTPGAATYSPRGGVSDLARAISGEALRQRKVVLAPDPCLTAAASELAAQVRSDCRIWPRALEEAALHHAGCSDGSSYSLLICSERDSNEPVLDAVERTLPGLASEGVTDVGAVRVRGPEGIEWVNVALFTERRVRLGPFPRKLAPGEVAVLSGTGAGGIGNLRLHRLDPDGEDTVLTVSTAPDGSFALALTAPAVRGIYWYELMGDTARGPTVLALFPVACGEDPPAEVFLPTPPDESAIRTADDAEALAFRLMNEDRKRFGLPALRWNESLARVARAHAEDMLQARFFGHVSPTTGHPGDRFRRARLRLASYGENLGKATTIAEAQDGIMASPAHRSTLLHPSYTDAGAGVAIGNEGGIRVYLVAQEFGRPQADWTPQEFAGEIARRLTRWRREAGVEDPVRDAELDAIAGRLVVLAERGVSGQDSLRSILATASDQLRLQGTRFRSLHGQSQLAAEPADVQTPKDFDAMGRDRFGIGVEERPPQGVSRMWAVLILVAEE